MLGFPVLETNGTIKNVDQECLENVTICNIPFFDLSKWTESVYGV